MEMHEGREGGRTRRRRRRRGSDGDVGGRMRCNGDGMRGVGGGGNCYGMREQWCHKGD